MERINVLVTSAGGAGHGSSIVKALLQSSLNLNIIGADMSEKMLQTVPLSLKEVVPEAKNKSYFEKLHEIIKKHSIHCIFTGSEQELMVVSRMRKDLEVVGTRVFLNNPETIALCKNKLECSNLLIELGFSPPKTVHIETMDDLVVIDFFPVVIKPFLESGASANVFVANHRDELELFATYLLKKNIGIIAQEYLPYSDNEYTVGVTTLLDESKVVGSIALRKFMEGLTRFVYSKDVVISSGCTQGEFQTFQNVRKICEQIAIKIESTGPLNIQLRLVNGVVKPFEINPRFSGTTSARAFNGYNEPEFFIRKYIMDDSHADESLKTDGRGFVVKGLDERYFPYE